MSACSMTSFVYFLDRWLGNFQGEGGLQKVAESYKTFGLHIQENGDIKYKEWAPSAQGLTLVSQKNEAVGWSK